MQTEKRPTGSKCSDTTYVITRITAQSVGGTADCHTIVMRLAIRFKGERRRLNNTKKYRLRETNLVLLLCIDPPPCLNKITEH